MIECAEVAAVRLGFACYGVCQWHHRGTLLQTAHSVLTFPICVAAGGWACLSEHHRRCLSHSQHVPACPAPTESQGRRAHACTYVFSLMSPPPKPLRVSPDRKSVGIVHLTLPGGANSSRCQPPDQSSSVPEAVCRHVVDGRRCSLQHTSTLSAHFQGRGALQVHTLSGRSGSVLRGADTAGPHVLMAGTLRTSQNMV